MSTTRGRARAARSTGKVVPASRPGGTYRAEVRTTRSAVSYLADRTGQSLGANETEGVFETQRRLTLVFVGSGNVEETLAVFTRSSSRCSRGMVSGSSPTDLVAAYERRVRFPTSCTTWRRSRAVRIREDPAVPRATSPAVGRDCAGVSRRTSSGPRMARPPHDTVEIAKPIRIEAVAGRITKNQAAFCFAVCVLRPWPSLRRRAEVLERSGGARARPLPCGAARSQGGELTKIARSAALGRSGEKER
jgi:hypothetical protein